MNYPLEPLAFRIERSPHISKLNKGLISKETNSYYNHITFSIKSLVDYIQVITAIANVHHDKFNISKKIYRGMSDSSWKLVPSLARGLDKKNNSFYPEYDMVSELISEKPDEFKGLSYNLEVLAKMQHYGLPTRLLDFSFSPLIALFFACNEKPTKSGRVVVGEARILHYNEPIVEAICGLYKLQSCSNIKIDDWLANYNVMPDDYLRALYNYYYGNSLIFVKPLYINERMRIQQSVFSVFTNELLDIGAFVTYYGHDDSPYYNEKILEYEKPEELYRDYIYIGKEEKENYPFWLTSEKVNNILNYYASEDNVYNVNLIERMVTGRFGLSEYIRYIEPYDILSNFCSIIIDPKSKRNILMELEKLGIDKSFVYPELEYTAEKVKKNILG